MTTIYVDKNGNRVYGEMSQEEAQRMTDRDLQRYGGKPTYTTERGEVPPFMRGEQDYRYDQNRGRYMIFDKKNNRFLADAPAPGEEEIDMGDFPVTNKQPQPVQRADRINNAFPEELPERGQVNDVPTIDRSEQSVMRARQAGPMAVETANKIKDAKDFLRVINNREKNKTKYKR